MCILPASRSLLWYTLLWCRQVVFCPPHTMQASSCCFEPKMESQPGFCLSQEDTDKYFFKKNYSLIWSDVLTRSTPASHIFCGEPGQLLSFLFVFVSCCTATLNLRTVTQLDSLSLLLLFAPPCHFPRHTNIYFGRKKGATLGLRRGGLVGESSL